MERDPGGGPTAHARASPTAHSKVSKAKVVAIKKQNGFFLGQMARQRIHHTTIAEQKEAESS